MKSIDSLLNLVFLQAPSLKPPFSSRDSNTLQNLHTAMASETYITEKQGNLLLQILNTASYSSFLLQVNSDYKDYINNPVWEKSWRIIPEVRKIFHIPSGSALLPKYSEFNENYSGYIGIDFTFSSALRKVINGHSKVYQVKSGSFYIADLTENNIVSIIDLLKDYNFDVEPQLQKYYDIITSWDKQTTIDQYLINNIPYPKFQTALLEDIGETTSLDSLIINDRRHRYNYTTQVPVDTSTLTGIIANRQSTKLWVDSTAFKLTDVVKSLLELKRFPLLIVFDQATDLNTITQFNSVVHALTNNNITDNIGIYFRLDNTPDGKIFNDAIANRKYNCMLDKSTQVAGVRAGKLPKFFLQSEWKPMSVISVNNSLRQSKTAVYAKCCDLVISYTHIEPIIETRNPWE